MPTQLENDLAAIKQEAAKFTYLNQFLNWSSIEKQAQRKYLNGITPTLANVGTPFDILQALLAPAISFSGPLDFKTNLEVLDFCIRDLLPKLDAANHAALKNKLSNIGNASFWDTLGELWFAQAYLKAGQNIKMDFALHPSIGNNQPSDADIAFLDANGAPQWLFDAVCPNVPQHLDPPPNATFHPDPTAAKAWLEHEVERKFNSKFAVHIANHPSAKAAIIITLIKADVVTGHLSPLLIVPPLGRPVPLDQGLKRKCPGLGYAIAVRFQRNVSTGQLEIVKLVELS